MGAIQQILPCIKVLGPELVTNGGFDADTDWTKSTGITIGSGVCSFNTDTATRSLTQSSVVNIGDLVRVSIEITSQTTGGIQLRLPFDARGDHRSTVGVQIWEGVATDPALIIYNNGNGINTVLDIDNVSVKKIL